MPMCCIASTFYANVLQSSSRLQLAAIGILYCGSISPLTVFLFYAVWALAASVLGQTCPDGTPYDTSIANDWPTNMRGTWLAQYPNYDPGLPAGAAIGPFPKSFVCVFRQTTVRDKPPMKHWPWRGFKKSLLLPSPMVLRLYACCAFVARNALLRHDGEVALRPYVPRPNTNALARCSCVSRTLILPRRGSVLQARPRSPTAQRHSAPSPSSTPTRGAGPCTHGKRSFAWSCPAAALTCSSGQPLVCTISDELQRIGRHIGVKNVSARNVTEL
jgi:hypothetical protein